MTTKSEKQEFLEERFHEYLRSAMAQAKGMENYAEAIGLELFRGYVERSFDMGYINEKIQSIRSTLEGIEHDVTLARKAMRDEL